MEKKKIAIIGAGGRTGTMFAFELRNSAQILGVGRETEVKAIREGKLGIERQGKLEQFKEKVKEDKDFKENPDADIIFLATKNPVSPAIKYYFQKFIGKEKIPALLLSQNGISAIDEAKKTLKEIFGQDSEKIKLARVILFNPVEKREVADRIYIKYSLPIRIALAKISGPGDMKDIAEIFKAAGFEVKEFPEKEAKNLELSKLFLNLIGMASAVRGLSIKDGFSDKETFKEEIGALREYIKVVKGLNGSFINLPGYPVKLLTILLGLPDSFLAIFRKKIARLVSRGREGKIKDLEEIEFYNGAAAKKGRDLGIKTPINEKIYKSGLERLR